MKPNDILYRTLFRLAAVLLSGAILSACTSPTDNDKTLTAEMRRAAEAMNGGHPDTSLEIYRQLTQTDPATLSLAARAELVCCYSNMAYILMFERQDYIGSYEALMDGKEIAEKLPNCSYLPEIYINLAALFGVYGDTRLSQQYFGKTFDEALYRRKWDALLTAVYNMAIDEISGNLGKDCQQRLDKFARMEVPEHPMREIATGMVKAYTLNKEGRPTEALATLERIKSQSCAQRTPERIVALCDIYALHIANAYGLNAEAARYAERLDKKADATDTDLRISIYKNLSYYYGDRGDSRRGLRYQIAADQLGDSIFAVSKYSLLHDMHLSNEQKRHQEALTAEQGKRKQWTTGFVIAALYVLVLLVAVVAVVRKNRNLQARNRELYLRYAESQRQADELVQLRSSATISDTPAQPDGNEDTAGEPAEANEPRTAPNLTALAEKVVAVFADEQEVTQQDFSLDKLARLTQSNRNYVSQVINTIYKKNFNSVLGEARVGLACRRLAQPGMWRNVTVEALAESVGFKSRSNFVVVFKKVTGLSPSEYRRQSEK